MHEFAVEKCGMKDHVRTKKNSLRNKMATFGVIPSHSDSYISSGLPVPGIRNCIGRSSRITAGPIGIHFIIHACTSDTNHTPLLSAVLTIFEYI